MKEFSFEKNLHEETKNLQNIIEQISIGHTSGDTLPNKDNLALFNEARILVSKGADANTTNKDGDNLLHLYMRYGLVALSKYLFKAGVNVNAKNNADKTPIDIALDIYPSRLTLEAFNLLINNGADISIKDKFGSNLIHRIIVFDVDAYIIELVKLLIDKGVDVNEKNDVGDTPLHELIKSVNSQNPPSIALAELEEFLIARGANVDEINSEGFTPLGLFAFDYDLTYSDLVLLPLVKHSNKIKSLSLLYYIENRYTKNFIKALIENKINLNEVNPDDNITPLHAMIDYGDLDLVEFLINAGANVNYYNQFFHQTILDLALSKGDIALVRLLIKNGAKVDLVTYDNAIILQDMLIEALELEDNSLAEFLMKRIEFLNNSANEENNVQEVEEKANIALDGEELYEILPKNIAFSSIWHDEHDLPSLANAYLEYWMGYENSAADQETIPDGKNADNEATDDTASEVEYEELPNYSRFEQIDINTRIITSIGAVLIVYGLNEANCG